MWSRFLDRSEQIHIVRKIRLRVHRADHVHFLEIHSRGRDFGGRLFRGQQVPVFGSW